MKSTTRMARAPKRETPKCVPMNAPATTARSHHGRKGSSSVSLLNCPSNQAMELMKMKSAAMPETRRTAA